MPPWFFKQPFLVSITRTFWPSSLRGPCKDLVPCSFWWVLCTRVELCPPVPILTAGSLFTDVPFVAPLQGRAASVRRIAMFLPNPAHSHLCLLTAEGFQVLFLAQFFINLHETCSHVVEGLPMCRWGVPVTVLRFPILRMAPALWELLPSKPLISKFSIHEIFGSRSCRPMIITSMELIAI